MRKLVKKRIEGKIYIGHMYNKAITLISLVITIIILILLAGITINLCIGDNGIFKRAKETKNEYLGAIEEEQQALNQLYMQLGIDETELPENTPETQAGTLVRIPDNWYTQTPIKYAMPELQEIQKTVKVAKVYAVSDGKNNIVPIPYSFFYVGGNLDTGVVISDNEKDKNKYKNVTDGKVPAGIRALEITSEEGKTKYKLEDELLGNQFVWVPCTKGEYHKTSWGQGNVSGQSGVDGICYGYWDPTTNSAEITQIEKYGGFYVGRYEASLPVGTEEYTEALKYDNDKYDYDGTAEVKAGRIPWNFISWEQSQKNARKMYEKNEIVASGLITGTQWDVVIKKMEEKESKNLTDSRKWGNYRSGDEFTYTGRAAEFLHSDVKQYPFGDVVVDTTKEDGKCYKLTTGASDHNRAYNIYDIAGNLSEWVEESCVSNTISEIQTNHCIRGGCSSYTNPACSRDIGNYGPQSEHGFRIVLYIK